MEPRFKMGQWVKYLGVQVPIVHTPVLPFNPMYVIKIEKRLGHHTVFEEREVTEDELSEISRTPESSARADNVAKTGEGE